MPEEIQKLINKMLEEFTEKWATYFFRDIFSKKEMIQAIKEMLEEWDTWRSNV